MPVVLPHVYVKTMKAEPHLVWASTARVELWRVAGSL